MHKIALAAIERFKHPIQLWIDLSPINKIKFNGLIFPQGFTIFDGKLSNHKLNPLFREISKRKKSESNDGGDTGNRTWDLRFMNPTL